MGSGAVDEGAGALGQRGRGGAISRLEEDC